MNMGIIAEDESDVAVVRELTLALVRPHKLGFKRFVGNGCGKLRRKARAWADNLAQQGCLWIAVIHDLDANHEGMLRAELEDAIANCGRTTIVLIPRREIEAWLLYDPAAIARAFRESAQPKLPGNPESLADPKKHLRDLIRRKYRKEYLHTVHNAAIAKHVKLNLLEASLSFRPHVAFTRSIRQMLPS